MWAIFFCEMVEWIARGWKWQIRVKRKKISRYVSSFLKSACGFLYLYAPPLSSGCTCCSTAPHGAVAIKYSLLTQFLRLSGIRPVHTQKDMGAENWKNHLRLFQWTIVQTDPCTCDGSSYLSGSCFSHLQRGLLTVPGCVRRADQIGSIF